MGNVLSLQIDDIDTTPGEEKVSMLSQMACCNSDVSLVLCAVIKRRHFA